MTVAELIPLVEGFCKERKLFGYSNDPKPKTSPSRSVKKNWSLNLTASYIPNGFRDVEAEFVKIQEGYKGLKELIEKVAKCHKYEREFYKRELLNRRIELIEPILIDLTASVTEKMMNQIIEDLQDQAETRFQLFFTQILLVIKTHKVYALHDTHDQVGQGKKYYPAAHCATIPSLKYSEGADELDFASGTRFGHIWNVTTLMPKESNTVDLCIDGKNGAKNRLRYYGLGVLNTIASDPNPNVKKAFSDFITLFVDGVNRTKKETYAEQTHPHQWITLECYLRVGHIYQEKIQKNDDLLKRMCLITEPRNPSSIPLSAPLNKYVEQSSKDMQSLLANDHARILRISRTIKKPELMKTRQATAKEATQAVEKEVAAKEAPVGCLGNGTLLTLNLTATAQPVLAALKTTGSKYKDFCAKDKEIQELVKSYFENAKSAEIKTQVVKKANELICKKFNLKSGPQGINLIVEHLLQQKRAVKKA